MRIAPILVTPLVAVVAVTYSYHTVRNLKTLKTIWPLMLEQAEKEIEIPTATYVGHFRDEYMYNSKESAIKALTRYYEDTVKELESIKNFLNYARRLFIVSGIVNSDREYNDLIKLYYDIGMYIEVNKNDDL